MFVLSGSLLWRVAACAYATACLLLVRDLPALLQSLAVNSTGVSSFSEEYMHGREKAQKGSKIQHFPPSSQHSKRL